MAYRDKSQGFAFVYVNIKKLLASKKPLDPSLSPPAEKSSKVINFNKDRLPKKPSESPKLPPKQFVPIQPSMIPTEANGMNQVRERAQAIAQIRKNLDRLQSLHHKLHTMLDDLNKVAELRKKKNNKKDS